MLNQQYEQWRHLICKKIEQALFLNIWSCILCVSILSAFPLLFLPPGQTWTAYPSMYFMATLISKIRSCPLHRCSSRSLSRTKYNPILLSRAGHIPVQQSNENIKLANTITLATRTKNVERERYLRKCRNINGPWVLLPLKTWSVPGS